MIYYKIEALLLNFSDLSEDGKRLAPSNDFSAKVQEVWEQSGQHCMICVSFISSKKIVLAAVSEAPSDFGKTLSYFWEHNSFKVEKTEVTEITFKLLDMMLRNAARRDYIDDIDTIYEQCGLSAFEHRYTRPDEQILPAACSETELREQAGSILCEESLMPELDRIFAGSCVPGVTGQPVHYLVASDSPEIRKKILQILAGALFQAGRISLRRITTFHCFSDQTFDEDYIETLFSSSRGGVLVADASAGFGDEAEIIQAGSDSLLSFCRVMQKYKSEVLTVFCLARSDTKSETLIMENMETCSLIKLDEQLIKGEKARDYLDLLAQRHGIEGTEELHRVVADPEKNFLAADLQEEFDRWFAYQLKHRVYPQYADFSSARENAQFRKPTGSAFQELQKMIGLNEAKAVIQQAIDFYKIQRLYREKGVTGLRPAMHMVFKGNPGTAKTTAARLFAQIMKDNGLLSSGKLFEVGRADLVGRYVGWTAQIVRQKFATAKGGVLFIDEAYSLLDDTRGLYGDEALNTIVQEMENHRDDMVVILAGYPEEMDRLLARNPGLRSRIAFHVPFSDYNAEELYSISELVASQKGLSLDAGVKARLIPIFEAARQSSDFGNGRFARNMIEQAAMKQAGRLVKLPPDSITQKELLTLSADDFDIPLPAGKKPRPAMGFAV